METNDLLKNELNLQEIENYEERKINWVEGEFYDSWDKIVGHMKKLFGHKQIYNLEKEWKPFFLAHSNDEVCGKAQLIQNTMVRLPLIRQAVKKEIEIDSFGKKTNNEIEVQSFYLIGEKFDKRHDGFQKDSFAMDFYQYVVETLDDKKIFLFSETKLPSETSIFRGMLNELDDYSEVSRTMKIPSLSRIFFVKSAEPFVKTLSKENLVAFTREKKITQFDWLTYLVKHPFGTLNNFPLESELLHSAQMLSGKLDGWPLHICYLGPQGTRKTMGKGETTESKFSGEKIMVDSGNSRLKGLSASYKGTIAEPGYITKQERIAIIDEIGKMVEAEVNKTGGTNILGELNAILEHKERKVVSGNTSAINMKPTSKVIFITNPVNNRPTIYSHIGLIDPTMMSRVLWWVQDEDEQKFVLGSQGILRPNFNEIGVDLTPKDFDKTMNEWDLTPKDFDKHIYGLLNNRNTLMKKSFGVDLDRDSFLTIFDSCYCFICDLDFEKIQLLANKTIDKVREPMKGVWSSRAFHHIYLIVDGLCKQRCLFKDYDPTFTPKQEDYELAEKILERMVKGWDTNLSPKEDTL